MIVVRSVGGRAAPHYCCAGCGELIAKKGFYGWRWSEVGEDAQAAVSTFHPRCKPETDGKPGSWEFAPLEKLGEYLTHNTGNFRLSRMPPAGHKGLEAGRRTAERARALLESEPRVEATDKPQEPPGAALARPPLGEAPGPRNLPEAPPEPPKPTGKVVPCLYCIDPGEAWDPSSRRLCDRDSVPGKAYCPHHYAEIFRPDLVKGLHFNGRR